MDSKYWKSPVEVSSYKLLCVNEKVSSPCLIVLRVRHRCILSCLSQPTGRIRSTKFSTKVVCTWGWPSCHSCVLSVLGVYGRWTEGSIYCNGTWGGWRVLCWPEIENPSHQWCVSTLKGMIEMEKLSETGVAAVAWETRSSLDICVSCAIRKVATHQTTAKSGGMQHETHTCVLGRSCRWYRGWRHH